MRPAPRCHRPGIGSERFAENPPLHTNPDLNTIFFKAGSARNSPRQFDAFSTAHRLIHRLQQPLKIPHETDPDSPSIHPQSTSSPRGYLTSATLDVGHAPAGRPKYSALFLAQPLGPQYKGAPPKPRVWITLADANRHTDLLEPSPTQQANAPKSNRQSSGVTVERRFRRGHRADAESALPSRQTFANQPVQSPPATISITPYAQETGGVMLVKSAAVAPGHGQESKPEGYVGPEVVARHQGRAPGSHVRALLHAPGRRPVRDRRVGAPRRGDHRRRRQGVLRAARRRVPARPGRRPRPTSSSRSTSAARSARRSASARCAR